MEYEKEKKLQRYNEALANNKHLRNHINHLRKERSLYDKIFYNLELQILRKKKTLLKLIEETDMIEKRKLALRAKLELLQKSGNKEQESMKTEYDKLLEEMENKNIASPEFGPKIT